MKTCRICGETKPLSEFAKRARNKDGVTGRCKPCKRAYDNGHYASNPQRRAEIRACTNERRQAVREWVAEYLREHPCVDCGEQDIVVLQFDHVNGTKAGNVSRLMADCGIKRIQQEIAKCVVRCANCHTRKTAADFGWGKLAGVAHQDRAPIL